MRPLSPVVDVFRGLALLFALFAAMGGMSTAAKAQTQTLTVAVDNSMAAALVPLVRSFEAARPGVSVRLQPGTAGELLEQVARSPGIDVLAGIDAETASTGLLRHLLKPDLRSVIASNTLVLVVPAAAPTVQGGAAGFQVTRLVDLSRPEVQRIGIGRAVSVPSGRFARQAINSQRLWPSLQRKLVEAGDEATVLGWLGSGAVDAGFVYGSTAASAGEALRRVQTLPTAQPLRHLAHVTGSSRQPALAEAFVAHLRSDGARVELQRLGFGPP